MKKIGIRYIISLAIFSTLCIMMIHFLSLFIQKDSSEAISTTYAFANSYSLLAGAYTIGLLAVSGLFFYSFCLKRTDLLLIFLILSYAFLVTNTMVSQSGQYFLSDKWYELLTWNGLKFIPSHTLLLFLLLRQEKCFQRYLIRALAVLSVILTGYYLISLILHSAFSSILNQAIYNLIHFGQYETLMYWLTLILLLTCTGSTLYCFIKSALYAQIQKHNMQLQNDLTLENYRTLQDYLHQAMSLQENTQQQIEKIKGTLSNGQYNTIAKELQAILAPLPSIKEITYCENEIINEMLIYFTLLASKYQITFHVDANVPDNIACSATDLQVFLFHLLSNSFCACQQSLEVEKRFVNLNIHYEDAYLAIFCDNPYNGVLKSDENGNLLTTKEHLNRSGFGLEQMHYIASKYNSTLSIQHENHVFQVHTALKLALHD